MCNKTKCNCNCEGTADENSEAVRERVIYKLAQDAENAAFMEEYNKRMYIQDAEKAVKSRIADAEAKVDALEREIRTMSLINKDSMFKMNPEEWATTMLQRHKDLYFANTELRIYKEMFGTYF